MARFGIAGLIAVVALISYCSNVQVNPETGERQHVAMSPTQEISLGMQAVPQMSNRHGGVEQGTEAARRLQRIGERIVARSDASRSPYQYSFQLLKDRQTVNAFALPGGPVFMTRALYDKLPSDGQLAAVLAHEVGHVVGRHSAEQLAKAQLTQGLTGAAAIAAYDPSNPASRNAPAVAAMVGQLLNLRYSRQDEYEADRLGVKYMVQAGYHPDGMLKVQAVLESLGQGGARPPEMLSSHPDPGNRTNQVKDLIQELFPNGVPPDLEP
jgi:predicted Zn-dependent protease